MADKNNFIFYAEYVPDLAYLNGEDFKTLMFWLSQYQQTSKMPDPESEDVDNTLFCLFCVLSRRIDYDDDRYQERVERNRQNGCRGGRPRKNPEKPKETQKNPEKPNHNPTEPRKSLMGMDMDMDMESSLRRTGEIAFPPSDLDEIKRIWNEIPHVTKIQKISLMSPRYNELCLCMAEFGREGVLNAINKIRDSEYFSRRGNVSFDTYMKPAVMQKVLEGTYDKDYSRKDGGSGGFEFGWDPVADNHD